MSLAELTKGMDSIGVLDQFEDHSALGKENSL